MTLTKTAATVLAAAFLSTGAAFADDSTLTENIYAEIDATQAQTYELVTASAEERVSELAEAGNEAGAAAHTESFTGS